VGLHLSVGMGIGGSQKGVLRPARGLLILPFKGVDLFGKASIVTGRGFFFVPHRTQFNAASAELFMSDIRFAGA
jgi:hypothetical protein